MMITMKNNGRLWSMQTIDVFVFCGNNGSSINGRQVHDILV
jgi:hypothetical protein